MRPRILVSTACVFMFLASGCNDLFLGPTQPSTPTAVFDYLWHDFDQRYALFEVDAVNWDSMYARYRPRVSDQMSDSSLLAIFDSLLTPLHDGHVNLIASGQDYYYGAGFTGYQLDSTALFNFPAVDKYYLGTSARQSSDGQYSFGTINDSIGYLNITGFYQNSTDLDSILGLFSKTKGLIVDVRNNGGGSLSEVGDIVGRFASGTTVYANSRLRNGPNHSDFGPWRQQTFSRGNGAHYSNPIVLLTNRGTLSAAEWFTLAMRTIPGVRIVGDTTFGAFSGRLDRELPNGWFYSLSGEQVVDQNFTSYQRRGIPPEYVVLVTQLSTSHDVVLEKAIELLR